MADDGAAGLRAYDWSVTYSHEDGNLVNLFFEPVLRRAQVYQRATGYFSGDVLAMAARGVDALIERGGRMELLVGCTLDQKDIEQIEKGYDVREHANLNWHNRMVLSHDDGWAREQIGHLAWMIAHGFLDVKLAVPLDERGRMRAGLGLYHEKCGIVIDEREDVLVFKGSINETAAGWTKNCESFDVNCSWRGETDLERVRRSRSHFDALWSGRARSARVLQFPEALREKLLEYLPQDDTFVAPPQPPANEGVDPPDADDETDAASQEALPVEEQRRLVWSMIRQAPRLEGGETYSLETSAVQAWPHQIRAYRRMLEQWPFRLLIADEVGLGKTIEAGMILRHAWISGLAKRILILAPKSVLGQWQAELYEKFNLLVPIYTGQSLVWPEHHGRTEPLEQKVDRAGWAKQPFVLAGSQLMRRSERQKELTEDAEPWDLLVVDEAHHARRKAPGSPQEGGPNKMLRLMQRLKDRADAMLLLTATPMQVHPVELWDLLNLLGLPQEWDEKTFLRYFQVLESNPDAGQLHWAAQLFQSCQRQYGDIREGELERITSGTGVTRIGRRRVMQALEEQGSSIPLKQLDTQQRRMALATLRAGSPVRHLMSRHTRALLRKYYDEGLLDSPIARRMPIDREIPLTDSERAVYNEVERYISETYQGASPEKKTAVGFVMTVYRRRLASSFAALRETLMDRLDRLKRHDRGHADDSRVEEDVSQDEAAEEVQSVEEAVRLEEEALAEEETEAVRSLLRDISQLGVDSKAKQLVNELQTAIEDGYDAAIIFTQYTDTMDFLRDYVADRINLPIGCYSGRGGERRDSSGKWTKCSKEQIKRLLDEGKINVLICTDAAGEGLNLQTCGVVVNYDLPWNPMKVEQRIGRIDRIGQRHSEVRVVNYAYENTVESDIYFALSDRIGLFHGMVGKLQPILSQLPKEFEQAALKAGEDAERTRHEARQHVEQLVTEAEDTAFDIDTVSDADLRVERMPVSRIGPKDVETALKSQSLRPPGIDVEAKDRGTFGVRIPGHREAIRVTCQPSIFEAHFENHQLALPDSPVFARLFEAAGASGPESEPLTAEEIEAARHALSQLTAVASP